eukprot:TRINITY_DN17707_c0_g2_i3.p1 TRINITY_DN17707_c0_g2~~TRINITY_DN17707_c0_g2_i3.p1  ORF type:complete len:128 (-),score=8.59 TRINITY_DN17707_c0_g2_i3:81-464(-)
MSRMRLANGRHMSVSPEETSPEQDSREVHHIGDGNGNSGLVDVERKKMAKPLLRVTVNNLFSWGQRSERPIGELPLWESFFCLHRTPLLSLVAEVPRLLSVQHKVGSLMPQGGSTLLASRAEPLGVI